MGWLAGSTAAEGARRGCSDVSVMDHESVALAATPVHDLSPLSPLSCSWLAVGGVPWRCSRGLKVRAVCVLEEVRVCDRGRGLLVLFLGKLPDVLARL
jgi:hypothetical protein